MLLGLFRVLAWYPIGRGVDRLAARSQKDMTAREGRFAPLVRNKVNQRAPRRRPLLFEVLEVEAGRRILEHKIRPPGIAGTSAVTPLVEESQFRDYTGMAPSAGDEDHSKR